MQEGEAAAEGRVSGAGLCNGCAWQRVVESGRGSRFSLCRRAEVDERFVRYPPLPVVRCIGYEPRGSEPG